jgi:hypothetical protein
VAELKQSIAHLQEKLKESQEAHKVQMFSANATFWQSLFLKT